MLLDSHATAEGAQALGEPKTNGEALVFGAMALTVWSIVAAAPASFKAIAPGELKVER